MTDAASSAVRRWTCCNGSDNLPVLLDPRGEARKAYEVAALPTTYVIGKDGKISGRIIGAADWDGPESNELVESLLNSDTKSSL